MKTAARLNILPSAAMVIAYGILLAVFCFSLNAQAGRHGSRFISKCANGFANIFRSHPHPLDEIEIERAHPTLETVATLQYDLRVEQKRIDFDRLQNVMKSPDAIGLGFQEALKAQLDGHEVFIKVSSVQVGAFEGERRTFLEFQNEVAWVKRLSDLGIGPQFKGVTEKDGHYAIVTEFIHGQHLSLHHRANLPRHYRPSPQLLQSLEHLAEVIRREGIQLRKDMRHPDLQIRITTDRAYVIDPEYFLPATTVEDVEASVEALNAIVTHLKMGFYNSSYSN